MKRYILLFLSFIVLLLMTQCSEDEGTQNSGQLTVKITDAPSDDANIEATFVTVADLKVDGHSLEGFQKQTIKISDLHSGKTEVLFTGAIQADTYSSISLVLDYEQDASGNAPGCYVLDKTNIKHDLNSSSSASGKIDIEKDFQVTASGTINLILDFDLRKSIVYNENSSGSSNYQLVSSTELKNSLRLVIENKSGEIKGKASNNTSNSQLIVFAYPKNEFNATTETQAQGSSNVLFANAVTSSKVKADGSYQLSFLEEGDYEIHVVSYGQYSSEGKLNFKGLVTANSIISGLLMNNVSVEGNASVELNFSILLLP